MRGAGSASGGEDDEYGASTSGRALRGDADMAASMMAFEAHLGAVGHLWASEAYMRGLSPLPPGSAAVRPHRSGPQPEYDRDAPLAEALHELVGDLGLGLFERASERVVLFNLLFRAFPQLWEAHVNSSFVPAKVRDVAELCAAQAQAQYDRLYQPDICSSPLSASVCTTRASARIAKRACTPCGRAGGAK